MIHRKKTNDFNGLFHSHKLLMLASHMHGHNIIFFYLLASLRTVAYLLKEFYEWITIETKTMKMNNNEIFADAG